AKPAALELIVHGAGPAGVVTIVVANARPRAMKSNQRVLAEIGQRICSRNINVGALAPLILHLREALALGSRSPRIGTSRSRQQGAVEIAKAGISLEKAGSFGKVGKALASGERPARRETMAEIHIKLVRHRVELIKS